MNSGSPKVSIVIPVCNVGPYVRECLDSVVGQTLQDIEILCVDDASTDGSGAILDEYAQRDPRVRLIRYETNRSASQARKDGALAATGETILFLDGDDYLDLNACEELYGLLHQHGVEILHFGTRVINAGNLPEGRVASIEKFARPHPGRIDGAEVFLSCFRRGAFGFTLWNKLYSAELCKRAFRHIPDGAFPKAQDLYAFFILAYLGRSYFGLEEACYHHYRFGCGITGRSEMSIDRFAIYCAQSKVAEGIRRFLEEQQVWEEHRSDYEKIRSALLGDCVWNWQMHVVQPDQARGFDLLVESWGAVEVVSCLAGRSWHKRGELVQAVRGAQALQRRVQPIRTIGTYYHRLSNGGVQRVLSRLIPLWMSLGHAVVLFTDEPPCEDDYPLPEGVRRVVLPSWREATEARFGVRAEQWKASLAENGVDAMVYHAWASPTLFWDLLVVKSLGLPMVVNTHSVFSFLLATDNAYFSEMPAVYSLCDAVVSLTGVDQRYWGNFARRAYRMSNPPTFDLERIPRAALEGQDVLWVGRFSPEKNPIDAIHIMAQVAPCVPGARLLMLGKGRDGAYGEKIEAEIDRLGLRERVVLCGYHQDVGGFYQAASVYLFTSAYEGFSLSLVESKSYGLPCVMYDMPYLEFCRDQQGLVAVGQGDVKAAAGQVVDLLQDAGYRKRMGGEARQSIEAISKVDLATGWREVFHSVGEAPEGPEKAGGGVDLERVMLDTLLFHYQQGRKRAEAVAREVEALNKQLAGVRRETDAIRRQLGATQNYLQLELDKKRKLAEVRASLQRELSATQRELSAARKLQVAPPSPSRLELSAVRKQLAGLRRSYSFRIGKAIMFLPNKIYAVILRWTGRGAL